ncbi:DUF6493 family protein [Chryseobacterium oncorhynchi]|uniref:Lantibiotic dehydratase n=1 Tax=Chryseobacterium oncorhynchi TaxID=741074 RepID=A0A316WSM2_9FLAO|nr:DUF6493 family protein [Chryseobacterium oncorhynchi]PWN62198.1 hypothetical protein C1638_016995 [Chryseobacterium oncorhynchi]
MLIDEEFRAIYLNYKIQEIVPFLKKLTQKDKKEVAAILKNNINKEWGHNNISVLASLVCSKTKNEYEKISPGYYSMPVTLIDELFENYVPEWIGESHLFVSEFEYIKVLEWEHKGYLKLNDEISASLLSSSLTSGHTLEEILFTYPVTIDSHIWLLFDYESSITYHSHERNWKEILKTLVHDNKIERGKVLKSCLNAINLNFSKDHNTWFLELFTHLEPTHSEIIVLQEELFVVFHSMQHSLFPGILKIVNPVMIQDDFKTEDFLQATASLMTLTTKNVVNVLLQTLEKIAKNSKKHHEEVCILLMPVFLNKDKTLQTKGAKILAKYGDPNSMKIQKELTLYTGSILSDARTLLEHFFVENEIPQKNIVKDYEVVSWHISQPIPPIETVDDFIFLASQIFNNNETYHFDLFLDALVRFNDDFKEEHFNKLEPAFKAALKRKESGGLHHLWATFLINYGLLKQKKKLQVLVEARSGFPTLENWSETKTPFVFKAYHQFLLGIFELLKQNKKLLVLSVPDQTPCWITVHSLVDKLRIYQQHNEQPIPFDWQIAMLRAKKENLEQAEQYAKEQLNEKYFELLKPIFDQTYFKDQYKKEFLEGNFDWELGYRKVYKWNNTEEIPQLLISVENQKELSENASYLDHLFNSYHGVYDNDLIYILYFAPYFSGPVVAKKYNKDLSSAVYQYDIKGSVAFLDAWMKLNLSFQPVHYLFLSAGLFNKDKTFSGMAFEVLVNKAVSENFGVRELGVLIGKKINFEWAPVKRFTDGLSGFINLSTSHNQAFEKLLISILSAIEKPVFNLKKLLELYYELLNQNQTKVDKTITSLLIEWEKENNLKKIIHQIKNQ